MTAVITAPATARATVLCLLVLSVLCVSSTSPASMVDAQRSAAITRTGEPGDLCKRGYTDYYWTLEDEFSGNESYTVFCGHNWCCECDGRWKPISVTMYLYWEDRNACSFTAKAEIREASAEGSACPVPGRLVVESEPTIVGPFEPAGLWAVTVALPHDSPTVSGPCFATLRFLDTCDELPAIVAGPAACEAMTTWVDGGDGPIDLATRDFPGNPSVFATFECQIPAAAEPVAWSAIKGRYTK
jgi:hypothetical protein